MAARVMCQPLPPIKKGVQKIALVISGLFTAHDPIRGLGQELFEISRVGSGRVGPGRVESGDFQPLTGWVGSDHRYSRPNPT